MFKLKLYGPINHSTRKQTYVVVAVVVVVVVLGYDDLTRLRQQMCGERKHPRTDIS